MARRAKARPPSEPSDGVFDTAAPPPPQAYVKGHAVTPPPSGPPLASSGAHAGAAAGAAGSGPWYSCGLGAGLLAQSPFLFAIAVLMSYSAALGLLAMLLWLLLAMCCGFECGPCPCDSCGSSGGSGGDGCCCCDGSGADDGGGSGGSGGSDDTTTGDEGDQGVPGPGLLLTASGLASALGLRRTHQAGHAAARFSLAHHPDLPEFDHDVVRWSGERYCVGCVTVYPVFLVASAAIVALLPRVEETAPWTWAWMLGAGLALALAQAWSAAGLARRRAAKVAVKASLGLGMALALQGLVAAPWPRAAQVAAIVGLLAAAFASTRPRRRRIAAALEARRRLLEGRA